MLSNKPDAMVYMNRSYDPAFNKNIARPNHAEFDEATKQFLNYLFERANPKQTSFNITDLNTPKFLNAHIANTTEGPGHTTILHYSNGADVMIFTSDCINHKDDITSHDISYVLREYGLYLDLTTYPSYIY